MKDMTICETLEAISQLNDNKDIERMLDYIQERATAMSNALKERRWVLVKDRLPKHLESVLTCDAYGHIHIMSHYEGSEYPFGIDPNHHRFYEVVAWQPLPQPYE